MIISSELAQSIVNETQKIIEYNINFMNQDGQIIASLDKERIGHFHEGAWEVLTSGKTVVVTEENEKKGALPGINLPVHLNNEVIGVIGITGSEKEVTKLGEVIQRMTEILIKEAFFEKQLALEARAKEAFIDEWLAGEIEDRKLFASRGWIMGINVHLPRIAIVLELNEFDQFVYEKLKHHEAQVAGELEVQRLRQQILLSIEQLYHPDEKALIIQTGNSKYTILPILSKHRFDQSTRAQLYYQIERLAEMVRTKFQLEISAGIGGFHHEDLGKSFQEAERALKIASKSRDRFILFYDELGLESLLDLLPKAHQQEFLERTLQLEQMSEKEKEQIIETLAVFFDCNQSINQAAEKLFIHKNTLQYRIKKIRDITGLDPRRFTEAVQLYTALLLKEE